MSNIIEQLTLTSHFLNIVVGLLLFIFGVTGNFLTIYIFTRATFRNAPSVRYLLAGSIASLIQLFQTLLPRILGDGFGIPIINSSTLQCQIRITIASVATLCSISFPCWASFDHFVSTSSNAAIRHYWTSKKFIYRAILITVIFWLIVFLPVNMVSRAVGESCIGNNIILSSVYSYGIIPLTYSILPIIAIIYFNRGIVRHLKQSRIVGYNQTRNRLVKQVRRMLIPQLMIIIISGIPFSINTIYSISTSSIHKDPLRLAIESLILQLVRLLFYLNYVCSFYIYILMSSEIRQEFKRIFCKQNLILPQNSTINASRIIPIKT
ncbi:unnamed protein product [Adineta steineri]|uniref:G-protein coupled receptors family 1 profile domain-containing protein n=2 Tax=Adineta steineri TaxID=433720 RepID=A0A815KKI9_9BILA|nr:unnamed protein product [Adineta steineri]CAF1392298.1 unnamed protein product [Adineta steineri]CAF3521675.1 unnamed protein product [Adineta steineri]CAF3867917.1 unnamed protein product [Adineta steineri]